MTYFHVLDVHGTARDDMILRADGASIPADPLNHDWQSFQDWLAAGNAPTPAAGPTRDALDAAIHVGCDATIAIGFSAGGASCRASMNLWVSSVLAAQASGAALSADDQACLAMVPRMNAWESAMFVERDRLISAALKLADAKWPVLLDAEAAFVASCNQG